MDYSMDLNCDLPKKLRPKTSTVDLPVAVASPSRSPLPLPPFAPPLSSALPLPVEALLVHSSSPTSKGHTARAVELTSPSSRREGCQTPLSHSSLPRHRPRDIAPSSPLPPLSRLPVEMSHPRLPRKGEGGTPPRWGRISPSLSLHRPAREARALSPSRGRRRSSPPSRWSTAFAPSPSRGRQRCDGSRGETRDRAAGRGRGLGVCDPSTGERKSGQGGAKGGKRRKLTRRGKR